MATYGEISRTLQQEAGDQEKPGYLRALMDPKYRIATWVCIFMAICVQATGINAINIYSTEIYKMIQESSSSGKGISPPVGSAINNSFQAVACLVSPFVSYFSFRTIINIGFLLLAILMTVVAILAYFEENNALILFMACFLAVFQLTHGTYSWVYLGQVACDEGLSIATFVLWTFAMLISIYTGKMFDKMTSTGVFSFFAVCCYISWICFTILLRETKGLSRD